MKMHLNKSKGVYFPACQAARPADNRINASATPADFKAEGYERTCILCQRIFLKRRNAQRKLKGLATVLRCFD